MLESARTEPRSAECGAGESRGYFLPIGPNAEQRLAVFNRLAVLDENPYHFARHVRFDFVHQLHRFDDAKHLPGRPLARPTVQTDPLRGLASG